ncbi:MAG: HAMP domain-containing sensor histidine kinase [Bacteroidota bacterium]
MELKEPLNETDQLKQELAKNNKELNRLSDRLLQAESIRSNFLSHVLNEINNPITSIIGLSRSIMDSPDSDPQIISRQAKLIHKDASELNFKLQNIFAAAKIEAGKVDLNPGSVDLNHTLESIIKGCQFKIRQKALEIEKDGIERGKAFKTDPELLQSILLNLILNAIEFSPNEGLVKVNLEIIGGNLSILISDEGPGITIDQQEIVFQRFRQLDEGVTKVYPGIGLGLSIVKEYVEMLQGYLKLESRPGSGSTFVIQIPALDGMDQNDDPDDFLFGDEEVF